MIKNWLVSLGVLASAMLAADSAEAATYSFDLSGDMSTVDIHNYIEPIQNKPSQSQWLELTNVATGLKEIAPFTLNAGDIVNVTISLNAPMTIPASDEPSFVAALLDTPTTDHEIDVTQSASFFNGGVPVSIPGLTGYDGSGGWLAPGAYTNATGLASFAFDKITIAALVTAILDDPNGSDISPLTLVGGRIPMLFVSYGFQSATTPIPGAALLMLTGLGALAGVGRLRHRKAASAAA
jgi:hypothetical protein